MATLIRVISLLNVVDQAIYDLVATMSRQQTDWAHAFAVSEILKALVAALRDSLKKAPSEILLFENYGQLCLIVDQIIFEVCFRFLVVYIPINEFVLWFDVRSQTSDSQSGILAICIIMIAFAIIERICAFCWFRFRQTSLSTVTNVTVHSLLSMNRNFLASSQLNFRQGIHFIARGIISNLWKPLSAQWDVSFIIGIKENRCVLWICAVLLQNRSCRLRKADYDKSLIHPRIFIKILRGLWL